MAYDAKLEKVKVVKEVDLENGWKAIVKIYSYSGGERKFKVNFKSESSGKKEFITSKFPGLTSKKGVANLIKAMQEVSKEL